MTQIELHIVLRDNREFITSRIQLTDDKKI